MADDEAKLDRDDVVASASFPAAAGLLLVEALRRRRLPVIVRQTSALEVPQKTRM